MHGEGRVKIISPCALFNSPVIFTEVSTHMINVLPFKNQRKQAQQLKRNKITAVTQPESQIFKVLA